MAEFSQVYAVDVTWAPYELHPETPPEGRDASELRRPGPSADAYREHLRAYAADAGIPLVSNRRVANSHRSLELAEFARDRGAFEPVHEALFHAFFQEARDIGDMDVLCDIAAANGLDAAEFAREAAHGEYAGRIDESTRHWRNEGVAGTPTMVFDDRFIISGAQDLDVYLDVLRRMGAARREV